MIIDPSPLPTHLAQVARRLNVTGPNASADTFLIASYVAEVVVKSVAIILRAGLCRAAPEHAYRLGHGLVRADGLGVWDAATREATSQPLAAFLPPDVHPILIWATKKRNKPEDEWFREVRAALGQVAEYLGLPEDASARAVNARDLITALVQVRNKTRAHGAVGPEFFAKANAAYVAAVAGLVGSCPAFTWAWMHLSRRENRTIRGVLLRGDSPRYMPDSETTGLEFAEAGVYFVSAPARRATYCGDLLRTTLECADFFLPNGGYTDTGQADFISYASGVVQKRDVPEFHRPPVPPPASETQGLAALDIQSNVFANLPPVPAGYVERQNLQIALEERLLDRNHHIVTLHGSGGVGKTSLALFACHKLASALDSRFEWIVWFSARDVDLRPTGPTTVRPGVVTLNDLARQYGALFSASPDVNGFAQALQRSPDGSSRGVLFVFDNFETLADPTEIHRFLDAHAHLPNKVLITSRERAFKADYPIEVRGMESSEAVALLLSAGRELGVEGLLTQEVLGSIYEYTEGHAYVMRVVLGEIAKERRYVPPKQLMTRRIDIVDAVFERSFNKLSESARRLFLTAANWKSAISELSLLVTLGQREVDVEAGREECLRFSLLLEDQLADGQPCYRAPQLARIFARKKLDGDPDRLLIEEDLETIRRFGLLDAKRLSRETQDAQVRRFCEWCFAEAKAADSQARLRLEHLLVGVAGLFRRAGFNSPGSGRPSAAT